MRSKLLFSVSLFLLVVALVAFGSRALAQTPTTTPAPAASADAGRTINVTGSGKATLTPDIAYVTIGVHTENKNASEAVDANNTQSQKLIDALKAFGIPAKDLRTTNFSIYPQQRYDPSGQPTGETTYMVDNQVYVTVRDLNKVGDLLDAAVKAGANAINGIQFDVADKTAALSDARKAAIADARALAQEMATAAGVELGDIQAISAASSGSPIPYYGKGGGMAAADVASTVPVQTGEMIVTVDVNVVFAIH